MAILIDLMCINNEVKRYVLGDWYDSFYILSLKDNKFTINKGRLK